MPEDTSSFSRCSICKSKVKNQQAHNNSHATQVFPWLYLGSKESASEINELNFWGITTIMNCTSEVSNSFSGQFNYHTIAITGGASNISQINEASYILESLRIDGKVVLVHCVQGVNRAAGVILSYLMTFSGLPLRDAYCFLKEKRTSIRLKRYLLQEIIEIELGLFGVNSLDLFELCENEND
jgi:dual specificity MAP kinase phosphatase